MITLRAFRKRDLVAVLALNKRSDSTKRTPDTWRGNNMTAMLAFDRRKLVGAIPLEPRKFALGDKKSIEILWVSGAHVDPDYRSQGIGTAMDEKIREHFFPEFKAVLVYRQDETSPAYKWYKQLGFYELLPVFSFKTDVRRPATAVKYRVLRTEAEVLKIGAKIYSCFNKGTASYGGFPQRHPRFLSDKFRSHYYKEFYTYSLLVPTGHDGLKGYAFLGQTDMRDGIRRIDILEMISPEDDCLRRNLYNAIMDYAFQCKLKEIRIQLSSEDPDLPWIKSLGFVNRWRTNIMGKLFSPFDYFKDSLAKKMNMQRKYRLSIHTPALGTRRVGRGKKAISLFTHDDLFNRMLLGRCDVTNAIEEGKMLFLDGDDAAIDGFKAIFPFKKWRYFHIDYI